MHAAFSCDAPMGGSTVAGSSSGAAELHEALDTYVRYRARPVDRGAREVWAIGDNADCGGGGRLLARRVLMALLRLSGAANEPDGFELPPEERAALLADDRVIDAAKLLDVCALYGRSNGAMVAQMANAFVSAKPSLATGIAQAGVAAAESIEALCGQACANMAGMSVPEAHELLDYVTDVAESMGATGGLCPLALAAFARDGGGARVASALAAAHDAMLPVTARACGAQVAARARVLAPRLVELAGALLGAAVEAAAAGDGGALLAGETLVSAVAGAAGACDKLPAGAGRPAPEVPLTALLAHSSPLGSVVARSLRHGRVAIDSVQRDYLDALAPGLVPAGPLPPLPTEQQQQQLKREQQQQQEQRQHLPKQHSRGPLGQQSQKREQGKRQPGGGAFKLKILRRNEKSRGGMARHASEALDRGLGSSEARAWVKARATDLQMEEVSDGEDDAESAYDTRMRGSWALSRVHALGRGSESQGAPEYEDEPDDTMEALNDNRGLGGGNLGGATADEIGGRAGGNGSSSSRASGQPLEAAAAPFVPGTSSKLRSYWVLDGKLYNAPREGAKEIKAASGEGAAAQVAAEAAKARSEIHGLGAGGNKALFAGQEVAAGRGSGGGRGGRGSRAGGRGSGRGGSNSSSGGGRGSRGGNNRGGNGGAAAARQRSRKNAAASKQARGM